MAISLDAVERVTFQGRSLQVISNNRTDTGAGILQTPLMPLPTLLLGLFGTPAEFFLRSSDTYDPATGAVTNSDDTVIKAQVYPEELTIARGDSTGQLQASCRVYVPGEVFGYASVALLILDCAETGDYQRHIETP